MDRRNVFEVVTPGDYHSTLIHLWFRLVRDSIVRKDDERAFSELGKYFVMYTLRTAKLPDYENILGWVATLNPQ